MGRNKPKSDVQWYLSGKKKPFAGSTVAESDLIIMLANMYGNGFIELIPIDIYELRYEPNCKEIVCKIQEDYQKYLTSKSKKKTYDPVKYNPTIELVERWFDLIDDIILRNKINLSIHQAQQYRCTFNVDTKQWENYKTEHELYIGTTLKWLNEIYSTYYDGCCKKAREHNEKVKTAWLEELNSLYYASNS